jgi:Peptidase family M28
MLQRLVPIAAALAALAAPALLAAQQNAPPAVVSQPDTKLPLTHVPRPTVPAITAADLMTRLYIYAADSMQGRETGTIGDVRATAYIAAEVKRMGLVPAGDDGGYFQTIPLMTRVVDSTSSIAAGDTPLAYGSEWAASGSGSLAAHDVPVVYGGALGDSAALAADQVKGKLVIYGQPAGRMSGRLFRSAAQLGDSAAATGIVIPEQFFGFLRRPAMFLQEAPAATAPSQRPVIFFTAEGAAKLFGTPVEQLTPGAAGKAVNLDVRIQVTPVAFPARNVVAILPGSDPTLKGEYVAIGAHNDHIGFNHRPVDHDSLRIFNHIVRPGGAEDGRLQANPEQQAEVNRELAAFRQRHPHSERLDSIDNGADDDGSGTVSALEIAQQMTALRPAPRRSIVFVWHTGEEKGLLGSTYFTDHPTVPRDSIVAQLNMDMVGRGDAWDITGHSLDGAALHGGPNYLQLVGSRRLSTELGDLIETVNTQDKHGFVFDYALDANGHPANIYCRSDHYEYARWGIPITFFTTGVHSDYHQVTDEPEYINYERMARVAQLVEDVAVHVADLDHRVVVDHPKPDPQGACRQ